MFALRKNRDTSASLNSLFSERETIILERLLLTQCTANVKHRSIASENTLPVLKLFFDGACCLLCLFMKEKVVMCRPGLGHATTLKEK